MDFKNLFLISAQVSNGAETDYEDIYYLNLGMNTSMRSFHDCLDPLVYESYQVDSEIAIDSSDVDNDDEDLGSNESDEEDMRGSYKFTTFTQVPPILFVTLEDRQDYQEQQKSKKEGSSYKLEKTIYLDRYLIENKDLALQKYQLAAQWKSDIRRTQKEIWNLQHEGLPQSISTSVDDANYLKDDTPVTLGKCQLLNTTAEYLNSQVSSLAATDENIEYIKSLQSIQQVLYHVRDDIEKKQKELKQLELERQESLKNLFDDPRLRKVPYDLRAVLHTDGLSGTGHYWGYIWVEPSEINLLEDIPVEGSGWYRFCDAMVEKVTEEDVWDERTDPFALVYADRSIQRFSKQQLDQVTPEDLLQFIQDDNAAFANEGLEDDGQNSIYNINIDNSGSNSSQHSSMQRSNSQISIGTDHYSLEFGNDENSEDQTPNYCQQGFTSGNRSPARSKESNLSSNKTQQIRDNHPTLLSTMKSSRLVDLAVANIIEMRTSIEGDYRFLKRFDLFLARAGDMEILARFYQLVNQVFQNNNIDGSNNPKVENNSEVGVKDSEISVEYFNNELDLLSMAEIRDIIRSDSTLVLMFEQYESYLSIGHRIASALTMFVYDNYNASLEHILEYYKEQSNWGIILASSNELLWKFPGLNDLSFRAIASKFGKACLKKLNDDAHTKACNLAYRNRGLQDGIRIAYQAIKFVNDDNHDNNNNVQFLSELGERWFDYAEGQSGTLTDDQAQLLNNLVMLYLDAASSIMLPENDQVTNNTDKLSLATSTDDSPIWLVFRKSLHDAEAKLLKTL
ncbi:uncharacterized protein BX664DRAFT_174701 [Halteromyces radiatus]|uniref:uncharacterized protein n=1 Tax=Halteromyces radiatus TaxID=101107 RepID=UPI00221E6C30|nr:uncharacterized protein BX664DRAFT_174701 [Halteromyces radiatus]KAI8084898.1 hypothetical protein BX664DRAFT_174701 [Halteromyces radiatus]